MSQNMVSLTVSEEQASSATAAIAQLGQALPGLVSLTPDDRKGLLYMGPRSEVFCEQVAKKVSGTIPYARRSRLSLTQFPKFDVATAGVPPAGHAGQARLH